MKDDDDDDISLHNKTIQDPILYKFTIGDLVPLCIKHIQFLKYMQESGHSQWSCTTRQCQYTCPSGTCCSCNGGSFVVVTDPQKQQQQKQIPYPSSLSLYRYTDLWLPLLVEQFQQHRRRQRKQKQKQGSSIIEYSASPTESVPEQQEELVSNAVIVQQIEDDSIVRGSNTICISCSTGSNLLLIPPPDVAWLWYSHRLAPVPYKEYIRTRFGSVTLASTRTRTDSTVHNNERNCHQDDDDNNNENIASTANGTNNKYSNRSTTTTEDNILHDNDVDTTHDENKDDDSADDIVNFLLTECPKFPFFIDYDDNEDEDDDYDDNNANNDLSNDDNNNNNNNNSNDSNAILKNSKMLWNKMYPDEPYYYTWKKYIYSKNAKTNHKYKEGISSMSLSSVSSPQCEKQLQQTIVGTTSTATTTESDNDCTCRCCRRIHRANNSNTTTCTTCNSIDKGTSTRIYNYNVLSAARRQVKFYWHVCLDVYMDHEFIQTKCISNYKRFLHLKRLGTNYMIVPTYPIDFVWHTHIVLSILYYDIDCASIIGQELNHDDDQNDRRPGSNLLLSYDKTSERWFELYNSNYKADGGYRGEPPRTYFYSFYNDPYTPSANHDNSRTTTNDNNEKNANTMTTGSSSSIKKQAASLLKQFHRFFQR